MCLKELFAGDCALVLQTTHDMQKITISRVNRDRRMGFCRQKLYWNVQNNWLSIIFSDETKIVLDRYGKVYVWRKPDERCRPDCLGQLDVRLLCFGGALRTMELELWLLLMAT